MSAVLHAPFMSQTREPFAPAFTAVNGRTSPKDLNMDAIHARSTPHTNEDQLDPKPSTSGGPDWKSVSRQPENGYSTISHSVSPVVTSADKSPHTSSKRRRSIVDDSEDDRVHRARDASVVITKPLFGPYPPTSQVASPKPLYQAKAPNMDHPRDLTLPPIDRPEPERRWNTEPLEVPYKNFPQESKPRSAMDLGDKTTPSMPVSHTPRSSMGELNELERENTMETTRAGVQVEMKKRKRQFANRTKTGCGTCRRRKKKCDEAKPECSNCTRGGFICEGYAKKVPWPTNGTTKQAPTLLARERPEARPNIFGYCPACKHLHIPHCDFPCRTCGEEHFPHCGIGKDEATRTEPGLHVPSEIENVRSLPTNRTSWSQPSQASYIEHSRPPPPPPLPPPPPTSYSQPPSASKYERPPSLQPQPSTHDRQPSIQPPATSHERQPSHDYRPPHQHIEQSPSNRHPNPCVHHHTPQGIGQVSISSPTVTTESKLHLHTAHQPVHQVRQPSMVTQSVPPPPPPPPPHYVPPPRQKTEKEKMLDGEPFLPYNIQLTDERTQCTGAVYRFNSTSNAAVGIAQSERERYFKYIVGAGWIQPRQGERHVSGHLGGSVHVSTPFQCDYGYNISVGDNVVIGSNCEFHDSGRIAIGRNTKIGSRVTITTLKTPTDTKTLKGYNGTEVAKEVYIGENVHIGDGCIVEAGVRIGNGAIIRPGSVVVRDVPPDCIALGNPANVRDVNWID